MKCRACGYNTGFLEIRDGLCRSCQERDGDPKRDKQPLSIVVPTMPSAEEKKELDAAKVIVTTSHTVSSRNAVEDLGVVAAEVGYGLNIFKDIANSWRDTFGGRSGTIQNALKDGREEAVAQLKREALALGADAVISTRIEYNQISTSGGSGGSILFVAAYGTAVKLEPLATS